jgi:hypothetical protein
MTAISPSGRDRTPNDRVIVSAGLGAHYAAGLESTRAHCANHCPDAWQLFYRDYPEGCPRQNEQQYAFKIWAVNEAVRQGFRYILWMDSVFQPIGSLEPLWEVIDCEGWYVPPQLSEKLGRWCSDAALDIFGIDRAEAYKIPLVYSGLVGVDMWSRSSILRDWTEMQRRGAFNGPHVNVPGSPMRPWGNKWEGHVSDNWEVQGHRHDESALSYILYSKGLTPVNMGFLTLESTAGFIGHHVPMEAECPGA